MKKLVLKGQFNRRIKVELSAIQQISWYASSEVLAGEELEYNGLEGDELMLVIRMKNGEQMTYLAGSYVLQFE